MYRKRSNMVKQYPKNWVSPCVSCVLFAINSGRHQTLHDLRHISLRIGTPWYPQNPMVWTVWTRLLPAHLGFQEPYQSRGEPETRSLKDGSASCKPPGAIRLFISVESFHCHEADCFVIFEGGEIHYFLIVFAVFLTGYARTALWQTLGSLQTRSWYCQRLSGW